MILLDVNILVYACRQDAERHVEYRSWLKHALDRAEGCGVSELVLSGCLRILTHPRVFTPPTPVPIALDYVHQFHEHPGVTIATPGERHWTIFIDLCRKISAKGNYVSDAYHAALAIESGSEWITADRDFARFPGLRWRHPLESP